MGANLDVSTTVNSVEMADLARSLRTVTPRSLTHVHSIARTINNTNALLKGNHSFKHILLHPLGCYISFLTSKLTVTFNFFICFFFKLVEIHLNSFIWNLC